MKAIDPIFKGQAVQEEFWGH